MTSSWDKKMMTWLTFDSGSVHFDSTMQAVIECKYL